MKISTSAYYFDESIIFDFKLNYKFVIEVEIESSIIEIIFEKDSNFKKNSDHESIVLSISKHTKDEFVFLEEKNYYKSYNLNNFSNKQDLFKMIKKELDNSFVNWSDFYYKSLEKFNNNVSYHLNNKKNYYKEAIKIDIDKISLNESKKINKNFIKHTKNLLENLFDLSNIKDNFNLMKDNDIMDEVTTPILLLFKAIDYIEIKGSIINKNNNKNLKLKI